MTRGKSRTDQGLNTDLTMNKDNIKEIIEDQESVPDRLIARIQKMGGDLRRKLSSDGSLTKLDIKNSIKRIGSQEFSSKIQRFNTITPGICELTATRIEPGYSYRNGQDQDIQSFFPSEKTRCTLSKDTGLQINKPTDQSSALQNGCSNQTNLTTGQGGLRYNFRLKGRFSSHQSFQSLSTIFRFPFPDEIFHLVNTTLLLQKEPLHIYQDSCDRNLSNTFEVGCQNPVLYGLHCNSFKIQTHSRNINLTNNPISERPWVENFLEEMLDFPQDSFPIPWLDVQQHRHDSHNATLKETSNEGKVGRVDHEDQDETNSKDEGISITNWRNQLSQVLIYDNLSLYERTSSNEDKSSNQKRLELQTQDESNSQMQLGGDPSDDKQQYSTNNNGTNAGYINNDGCLRICVGCCNADIVGQVDGRRRMDERLAPQIQQSTRDSSRLDGPSNVSNITLLTINNLHHPSNRQLNNGVQSSEMEGFFQPDSSNKKDCGIDLTNECPIDNSPYTWNRKLVCGRSQQEVMEGRLQSKGRNSPISLPLTQLSSQPRQLRNTNHEVMSKILLTITRPMGGGSRRILSPMDRRNDADSSSSGINPKSNQQSQTRWCNRTSDLTRLDLEEVYSEFPYNNCSTQSGINIGDPGRGQEDERFKVKTATRTANRRNDQHSRCEQIFGDIAKQSGLKEESIQDMIAKMNQEAWRKRRAGLDELADYVQSQETNLDSFISNKADIELVNALVWVFNKGGDKIQQRVKILREHGCATLSQFSEMKEISKSPLIIQFSKNHQQQAKEPHCPMELKLKNNGKTIMDIINRDKK
ncbi:MAG: hypothetical protein EZS28_017514 [Streblomastix strix]|uniref:Uncharacterized protein n=1 Tax=Streblomastix strix TaxID=222440 RepID=A0A5J4VWG0_9EUKA|nr:MAG: hypothetical protein EZS28_017514 [Streblomastix strix]